jgi:lipid-binding SYLF domain-containing protein
VWGFPAFYTLASASFGLQIGLEQAELILIVMSDRALNALMHDEFKVGAEAGLAVVTLGASVEGATTAAAGADIVVWSSASGAYAGLTINGSIVKPRLEWDAAYYGRPATSTDIVIKGAAKNPGADVLRGDLASVN